MAPNIVSSILDFLSTNAIFSPKKTAYIFHESDDIFYEISFNQLKEKVSLVASELSKSITEPKSRILIVLPPGINFIISFLACLASGMVAVPTFPPTNSRKLDRLRSIQNDCSANYIICSKFLSIDLTSLTVNGEQILFIEDLMLLENSLNLKKLTNRVRAEDIAFLQYTSGSTGVPKGVCISHRNIINNLSLIQNAYQLYTSSAKQTLVSWLPPYHDMGLIFGILFPLFKGMTCHLMAPQSFIQSPYRWLKLMSDIKATITGAPNFAFDLCTYRIPNEKISSLNLGSLQAIFNGAEPIQLKTLDNFFEKFSCTLIKRNAIYPAYGLAESTLFVTSRAHIKITSYSNSAETKRNFVSCGYKGAAHDIKIINPRTLVPCKPCEEGEIWINGPSVALGYWNQKELTTSTFHAKYKGGSHYYLRSGDLGFLDEEGELYVTGRIKDLIIINGQNIYPQDIETLAQDSHPSLKLQGCAAFTIPDLKEDRCELLIVVQEVHRHSNDLNLLESLIRKNVFDSYEVSIDKIVFIHEKSIPRTTSGKIQRQKCKEHFLNKELLLASKKEETISPNNISSTMLQEKTTSLSKCLIEIISNILNRELPKNFLENTLIELGFDSIKTSFLISQIQEKLQINAPFSLLSSKASLSEITNVLSKNRKPINIKSLTSELTGLPTLASLQQQKLWFLNYYVPYKQIYNLPIKIEMKGHIQEEHIKYTLQKVIDRHESLRTGFEELEELIIQKPIENFQITLDFRDLSSLPGYQLKETLKNLETTFSNFEFDIKKPSLFRACLVKCTREKFSLLLNFHHIIFDGYSLKLFLKEFSFIFNAIARPNEVELTTIQSNYKDFSNIQRKHLSGGLLATQIVFWKKYLENAPDFSRFTLKLNESRKFTYEGMVKSSYLQANIVHKLITFAKSNNVTPFTVLLAVYFVLFFSKTGQTDLIVGSPMSGRIHSYAINIIGLVMNILPIRVILNPDDSLKEVLYKVSKAIANVQDHQDIPFDLLIEHLNITRILDVNPLYQTLFTIRENWNSNLFIEGIETSISEMFTGYTKLDLSFFIQEKQSSFELQVEYSKALFSSEEISLLINKYQKILTSFVRSPQTTIKEFLDCSQVCRQLKAEDIEKFDFPFKSSHAPSQNEDKIERELYSLWLELFKKDEIGIHDNFFKLGGHSLLLNKMILRLKKDLGYVISIRDAFTYPTIASLSGYIKKTIQD